MRARVVLYNQKLDSVLLIRREKAGRIYWVVPGGGSKGAETAKETAVREIQEELAINLTPAALTPMFTVNYSDDHQDYFLAAYSKSEVPTIHDEELARSSAENIYTPAWVKLTELARCKLVPAKAAAQILLALQNKSKAEH